MIRDTFNNNGSYTNAHPLFAKAFEYLEKYLQAPDAPGKYEICGNDLFVMVQEYETRDEGLLEVHDKYIDIQCMINGTEKVYYASRASLVPSCAYDADKDVMFLNNSDACDELLLRSGEFMIFFPQDAHKPAMAYGDKQFVKKLVFKVKLDA